MSRWALATVTLILCIMPISSISADDGAEIGDITYSTFFGTVSDNETGLPISGAFVYAFDSDYANYYHEVTDQNGYYYMEVESAGVYYLYANMEDYDDQEYIAWIEPGMQKEVNFTLDPIHFDHVIYGEVVDQETNERLSDVQIVLYGFVGNVPRPLKEQMTNSTGKFSFNLDNGTYQLTFEKKDYYSEFFYFEISGNGIHLTETMMQYYQGVYGIVTDSSGSPIEGVTLCLENDESKYYNVSDVDGNFEIRIPYGGDFTLTAYNDGYRPSSEYVKISGEMEEVNLEIRTAEHPILLQLLYTILALLGIL